MQQRTDTTFAKSVLRVDYRAYEFPGNQPMSAHARLPSVDRIIRHAALADAVDRYGIELVKKAVRELQQQIRRESAPPPWATAVELYREAVEQRLNDRVGPGLRRVFNMTGTVIHTNLGRAQISRAMAQAGVEAAVNPVTLEYDLGEGRRGERDAAIEPMLCALTGAAAATVVNNNAAALLLVLNTLGLGKSVPVSRGELIEIGGSFRLPDLIERSGCRIREVGTTNRTHLRDFENAIDDSSAMLLKVHPSNYRIEGFTSNVDTPQLARLARAKELPLVVDLGSGALIDLERFGLPHEPTVGETLAEGADVVTFSGDKLLGSVQAGLMVGRRDLIDRINRNPLKRALRCDKITLAILHYTLRLYQDPERLTDQLPLLATLTRPIEQLTLLAERVARVLNATLAPHYSVAVTASRCQIGSGALPQETLASLAVSITASSDGELTELAQRLRALATPVIGRIRNGALWLDVRTIDDPDALCDTLGGL
jgi:L-seryl-tRNA(Ser) seleniumtransferase